MTTPLYIVDAFTDRAFHGNPAAVCRLDGPTDEEWMQAVAAEMNLSETAFVHPRADTDGFGLRWFTPRVEARLCGHATLAAAHVLWETGGLDRHVVAVFETRSGVLSAALRTDGIELDFPADPVQPAEPDPGLFAALGVERGRASSGDIGWFVELDTERAVRDLRPDFRALCSFGSAVVTAPSDEPEYDFVSRYFAPAYGIDEDPVTGSAHCALGPYWAARLGRAEVVGYQASRRGGVVRVRLDDERVHLMGRAVTVLEGTLT